MKKIKKIWEENRVLLVLAIVLIICIIIFAGVAITYFYGSNESPLGNRTDIIKEIPIDDERLKNIKNLLLENEMVSKVTTSKSPVKDIYINITFVSDTKMEKAKEIAESIIESFSEEELSVYNLQFTITVPNGEKVKAFSIMGARNANGSGTIIWGNYNLDYLEKEDAEE